MKPRSSSPKYAPICSFLNAALGSFVLTCAVVLGGCAVRDYGRAEFYGVSPQPAAVGSAWPNRREELIESIRLTLKERGFKEWIGKRYVFWSKNGVDVEWRCTPNGELTLRVSAFGDKSDLADSEQIELVLLNLVIAQPDLKVARVEPRAEDWE